MRRVATSGVFPDPYATVRDAWTVDEVLAALDFLEAREAAVERARAAAQR